MTRAPREKKHNPERQTLRAADAALRAYDLPALAAALDTWRAMGDPDPYNQLQADRLSASLAKAYANRAKRQQYKAGKAQQAVESAERTRRAAYYLQKGVPLEQVQLTTGADAYEMKNAAALVVGIVDDRADKRRQHTARKLERENERHRIEQERQHARSARQQANRQRGAR